MSYKFSQFSQTYDFEHIPSSPTFPQSNDMAEKAVQIAKNLLTKCLQSNSDPYLALLELRNTPRDTTIGSPTQRLFSRRTRSLLPVTDSLLKPRVIDPSIVQQRLKEYKSSQKMFYDRGARLLPELSEGQHVRLQTATGWKPANVVNKLENRSYIVNYGGRLYRRNRRHLLNTKEEQYDQLTTDTERRTDDLPHNNPPAAESSDNDPQLPDDRHPPPPPEVTTSSGRVVRRPLRYRDV